TACTPLTYTVTNGSGLTPFTYTFTPNNYPAGFTCTTAGNNGNCSDPSVGGSAGTISTLTATVTDAANVSVPNNSVTSSTSSMTVNNEMTITVPSPLAAAVVGRTFGTGSTCGAGGSTQCTPLTYTVPAATPGLGTYTFTPNGFPTNFTCPTTSNVGNCAATSVGGPAGTLTTPTVTVADTSNASTPKHTVTSAAISLTVDPEMTITATTASPFSLAVTGRTYGTGSTCGALGT